MKQKFYFYLAICFVFALPTLGLLAKLAGKRFGPIRDESYLDIAIEFAVAVFGMAGLVCIVLFSVAALKFRDRFASKNQNNNT